MAKRREKAPPGLILPHDHEARLEAFNRRLALLEHRTG